MEENIVIVMKKVLNVIYKEEVVKGVGDGG